MASFRRYGHCRPGVVGGVSISVNSSIFLLAFDCARSDESRFGLSFFLKNKKPRRFRRGRKTTLKSQIFSGAQLADELSQGKTQSQALFYQQFGAVVVDFKTVCKVLDQKLLFLVG